MSAFLGNAERGLSVLVLHTGVGARPEEEPHALALVLYHTIVERGVALTSLLVEAARVLYDEVDDVQGVTRLVRNRVVKTSFSKFLKNKLKNSLSFETVSLEDVDFNENKTYFIQRSKSNGRRKLERNLI